MQTPAAEAILSLILRSPLSLKQMRMERFNEGFTTRSEVVSSARFILICEGEVEYRVEDQRALLGPGHALFVPPWLWRTWQVPQEKHLDLLWVVFSANSGIFANLERDIEVKPLAFDILKSKMTELFHFTQAHKASALMQEAMLKVILSHFFEDPKVHRALDRMGENAPNHLHPEVRMATSWLRSHFTEPTALADLHQHVSLNMDYFRDLFHKQTHLTPQQYLTQLRMKAARFYLRQSNRSVKEIAMTCGFQDPQYFTRTYRKFWKHPPSAERG
ncbi:helix-turn-helix domain-containing protein [Kiritimatiellota bacterium B12222]|nr:helix-turn-helix domain-containing protein [Kiritimatiellota bacterium B12222]